MHAPSPRSAALSLINHGFSLIPLRSRTKVPACAHGKDDASRDPQLIDTWFQATENRNLAVVTGRRGPLWLAVVDVDPRNGGDETLATIEAQYGPLPPTPTVRTGGDGFHFYFKVDPSRPLERDHKLPGGIDIKCDGYVVAPPSVHPSGERYAWVEGRSPEDLPLATLPAFIADLIEASRGGATGRHGRRIARIRDEEVQEGGRNDALFRHGCSLRARGLAEVEIRGALAELNNAKCSPPLDSDEVARIVRSVLAYEPGDALPFTDRGNATRLVRSSKGGIRYNTDSKGWLVWSGRHWREDTDGELMRRAKGLTDQMLHDAELMEEGGKALKRFALHSQSNARLKAMIELASTEPDVPISFDDLDQDPHRLNVENGTVDLRTGALEPHDPNHRITKLIPLDYRPGAPAPVWREFLAQVTGGDTSLERYLQLVAGYAASGETSEQCLFMLYGSGANGKSTWLNAVAKVLGPYAKQTPTETLLAKNGGGASNDIARLTSARFVTASEVDEGRQMAEALVKQITGGEALTVRFLYGEYFQFLPRFKIFMGTNCRPLLNAADGAIWRRIRQIPFVVTVPPEQRDRALGAKLEAEAEGILSWIVEGAAAWYREGLVTPQSVLAATDDYRCEMDPVGGFLADACEFGDAYEVSASELYGAYRQWAAEDDRELLTLNAFGRQLTRRGIEAVKAGRVVRRGVRLKAAA